MSKEQAKVLGKVINHSMTLRRQIQQLRIYADDDERCFIPQKPLYKLLTKEALRKVLISCHGVLPYYLDELVEIISKGARKIFAILILLRGEEEQISRFVQSDGFQRVALDHKLPFPKDTLCEFLPSDAIDDFCRLQWEFIAPIFCKGALHRMLNARTRLPFVTHCDTGEEGGFGHIYDLEIHPEYQRFPDGSGRTQKFVRKEFLPHNEDTKYFETELHNLNLLNNLEHPNIVELLASWTHRGRHNLLFRHADDGDLTKLLNSKHRPEQFVHDDHFYKALCELSSAIQNVHQYSSEKLNLDLIGIHHDVKPQNILVQKGSFILADFGLSKFKPSDQSSKSLFSTGAGHYLAPECEDYERGFKKNAISRPSDIWSFGCVMAEICTYMLLGVEGIQQFKRERKVQVGNFTTYTFHAGKGKINPGLVAWLNHLDSKMNTDRHMLLTLIRCMLNLEPTARPSAEQVASFLSYLTVEAFSHSIRYGFGQVSRDETSTELQIEEQRFGSWYRAVIPEQMATDLWECKLPSSLDASLTVTLLDQLCEELRHINSILEDAVSPLFTKLRYLQDRLWTMLPCESQECAKADLELQIIQLADREMISSTDISQSQDPLHRRIGLLATMKRMNALVSERTDTCRSDLHLEMRHVHLIKPFEDHSLAFYTDPQGGCTRRVLIEWVCYDTSWEGPVSKEMYVRIEAIAELLHGASKPDDLRVLSCVGFFHMPSHFSFGLMYDFPTGISANPQTSCRSLSSILEETKSRRNRPSLNDRFGLAWMMASSLLDFHKASWMHKSISAYNVLFFHPPDLPSQCWLENPYIIGFNRSRPDDPDAFTSTANMDLKSQSYQHPRYQSEESRFCIGYDYYSLGVVLLAIGLWQTVEEMTAKLCHVPGEDTVEHLLSKRVPLLTHAMGVKYCDAVRTCIRWTLDHQHGAQEDPSEEERIFSMLQFEQLVVAPLARSCI